MTVSEAFTVVKGGYTRLKGEADNIARAAIAELRRRINALEVTDAEISVDVLTLADDQAAYIAFAVDTSRGVAVFQANAAAGGSGIVAFRVGTSAYTSLLASTGVTVTVGTGTLAGTTGTDTHLTIRADTATNRLYVENRTGATRTYGFSFLGMIGTVTGTWVTV